MAKTRPRDTRSCVPCGNFEAKLLVDITPASLDKVFFSDSGSVAVEVAIKMAIQYWYSVGRKEKSQLLALRKGYHGDTSVTFYVGDPSPEARHVTEVARRSLDLSIAEVREGARLGDIGAAIQGFAEGQGCSVVRAFVGHPRRRKFA